MDMEYRHLSQKAIAAIWILPIFQDVQIKLVTLNRSVAG